MNVKARIKLLTNRLETFRAYRKTFSTSEGQMVIQHLMKEVGILRPKIVTDPSLLLVRQGQQHVVYSILKIIGKDPIELQNEISQSLQQEEPDEKNII